MSLGGERTEVLNLIVEIRNVCITEETVELGLEECDSIRDWLEGAVQGGNTVIKARVERSWRVLGREAI